MTWCYQRGLWEDTEHGGNNETSGFPVAGRWRVVELAVHQRLMNHIQFVRRLMIRRQNEAPLIARRDGIKEADGATELACFCNSTMVKDR
jgi:hypothetical protein